MKIDTNFLLLTSVNSLHAELDGNRYQKLITQGSYAKSLKAINSIPSGLSVQTMDLEIFPEIFEPVLEFQSGRNGCELIASDFAHCLPDFLNMADKRLPAINQGLGTEMLVSGRSYFHAAYSSVPASSDYEHKLIINSGSKRPWKMPPACYVNDSTIEFFKEDENYFIGDQKKFKFSDIGADAVYYHDRYYFRMYNLITNPINQAWNKLQAWLNGQGEKKYTADELVDVIWRQLELASKAGVKVLIFPKDIEGCVIGSHHGHVIWEEVVRALQKSQLPLIQPSEAYFKLIPKIKKVNLRPHFNIPAKYYGSVPQMKRNAEVIKAMNTLVESDSKNLQSIKVALFLGLSDHMVVMRYRTEGRITIDTDEEKITFMGQNSDIFIAQEAVLRAVQQGKDPMTKAIKWLSKIPTKQQTALTQPLIEWFRNL